MNGRDGVSEIVGFPRGLEWEGGQRRSVAHQREACGVCPSSHWFSLKLMKSSLAQLNLFQNIQREKLILLCITLLGAKATKIYQASLQGEKCMVYRAVLIVRRPGSL